MRREVLFQRMQQLFQTYTLPKIHILLKWAKTGTKLQLRRFIKYNVDNIASGLIEEAVGKIIWAGSDPFTLDIPKRAEKISYRSDGLAETELCISYHKEGIYTIIGTTGEGLTARCTLIVKSKGSEGEGGSGNEDGSGNEGGSGDKDDSDDITTVTKTKEVEDDSYGVTTYKKSSKGNIQEKARKLEQAMNQFLEAIRKEAQKDYDSKEEGKNTAENSGRQMKPQMTGLSLCRPVRQIQL